MKKLVKICAIAGLFVFLVGCGTSSQQTKQQELKVYTDFAKDFIETTNTFSTDTDKAILQKTNDKFKDSCTESIYKGYLDLENETVIQRYFEADSTVNVKSEVVKSGVISSDSSGVTLINVVKVKLNDSEHYEPIYTKIANQDGKLKLVKLKTYAGKIVVL